MSKKIFVLDNNLNVSEIKKSNHCYIVAKNGIFFKDNQDNIETCTKIDNIEGLSSLEPYIKWKFPKITKRQFTMVASFFHRIHNKHRTECMVLIGWNRQEKRIEIFTPEKQIVSAASIKYDTNANPGTAVIGSIHSHSSMSAFHSGVDIADEMNFDGLHITLGKFSEKSNTFQISSQLTSGKMRENVDFNKIIENMNMNYTVKLKSSGLKDCSIETLISSINNNQCDIEYDGEMYFDENCLTKEDKAIIDEWEKTVEAPKQYGFSNDLWNKKNQNGYGANKISPSNFTPIKNDKITKHPIGFDEPMIQEEISLAAMYGVNDPDDLLIYDEYDLDVDVNLFDQTDSSKIRTKVKM